MRRHGVGLSGMSAAAGSAARWGFSPDRWCFASGAMAGWSQMLLARTRV